jgi:hypothetical protein
MVGSDGTRRCMTRGRSTVMGLTGFGGFTGFGSGGLAEGPMRLHLTRQL